MLPFIFGSLGGRQAGRQTTIQAARLAGNNLAAKKQTGIVLMTYRQQQCRNALLLSPGVSEFKFPV